MFSYQLIGTNVLISSQKLLSPLVYTIFVDLRETIKVLSKFLQKILKFSPLINKCRSPIVCVTHLFFESIWHAVTNHRLKCTLFGIRIRHHDLLSLLSESLLIPYTCFRFISINLVLFGCLRLL